MANPVDDEDPDDHIIDENGDVILTPDHPEEQEYEEDCTATQTSRAQTSTMLSIARSCRTPKMIRKEKVGKVRF